jgi:LPS export ABC transporter protein LptC
MTLNKKKLILLSVLVLLVALAAVTTVVIRNVINKPKNILKVLPDHVDLQIKDFVYTEVGEANSKWEVRAKTAQYDKKQNLAVFDSVQIKLTTAENKVYIMTGDKGRMQTEKKDIEIRGNVVIMSDSRDRFTTDYLKYSDAAKKFYTDAPVTMETKKMKITGVGLTLFMNTGELNLSSSVKATIN